MHEPRKLTCIFGCKDEPDNIAHYLDCLILWSIINEVFEGHVHPLAIGKVNFLEPNANRVIVISAAFEIYHALKIGLREVVEHALTCRRFGEVYRISHKLILEKHRSSQCRLNSSYESSPSPYKRKSEKGSKRDIHNPIQVARSEPLIASSRLASD